MPTTEPPVITHPAPLFIIPSHTLAVEEDLLRRFEQDIEIAGVVGEKENASITLLCAVSARLDKPLSLTVCGESSAGKNHLLGNVASFLPPEMVKNLTGLTSKALMHAGEDEFEHKAVFIAEYEGDRSDWRKHDNSTRVRQCLPAQRNQRLLGEVLPQWTAH